MNKAFAFASYLYDILVIPSVAFRQSLDTQLSLVCLVSAADKSKRVSFDIRPDFVKAFDLKIL